MSDNNDNNENDDNTSDTIAAPPPSGSANDVMANADPRLAAMATLMMQGISQIALVPDPETGGQRPDVQLFFQSFMLVYLPIAKRMEISKEEFLEAASIAYDEMEALLPQIQEAAKKASSPLIIMPS